MSSQPLSDVDLQALCEIHVEAGLTFGALSKEVRSEAGYPGIRESVDLTRYGLTLAKRAGNQRCGEVLEAWERRNEC